MARSKLSFSPEVTDPRWVMIRARHRAHATADLEVFVCPTAPQAWARAKNSVLPDLRRNLSPTELTRLAPTAAAPDLVRAFNHAAHGTASVVVLPITNVPAALLTSAAPA